LALFRFNLAMALELAQGPHLGLLGVASFWWGHTRIDVRT